jgi:hypothetical protein
MAARAGQIGQGVDARPARHQDVSGGMLEDDAQHHHFRLAGLGQDHAGRANAEIGLARTDIGHRVDSDAALTDFDVEAGVAVKAFLQRDVVAGELKLMQPLQLQRDLFQGVDAPWKQQHAAGQNDGGHLPHRASKRRFDPSSKSAAQRTCEMERKHRFSMKDCWPGAHPPEAMELRRLRA